MVFISKPCPVWFCLPDLLSTLDASGCLLSDHMGNKESLAQLQILPTGHDEMGGVGQLVDGENSRMAKDSLYQQCLAIFLEQSIAYSSKDKDIPVSHSHNMTAGSWSWGNSTHDSYLIFWEKESRVCRVKVLFIVFVLS